MIVCANCNAQGLVCEDHPEVPWNGGEGCCGGAGMQCKCQVTPKPLDEKELEDAVKVYMKESMFNEDDRGHGFEAGARWAADRGKG